MAAAAQWSPAAALLHQHHSASQNQQPQLGPTALLLALTAPGEARI